MKFDTEMLEFMAQCTSQYSSVVNDLASELLAVRQGIAEKDAEIADLKQQIEDAWMEAKERAEYD